MKKLLMSVSAAALCASVALSLAPVSAQQPASRGQWKRAVQHQVGLIDMAHVFKNYDKFKTMTKAPPGRGPGAQKKADAMIEEMKSLQAKITSGDLQEGARITSASRASSSRCRPTSKPTARSRSATSSARKLTSTRPSTWKSSRRSTTTPTTTKYTLILRFNRQEVSEAENPQQILNNLGRQVVYYKKQDDVTQPILDYLNDEFKKNGGVATPRGRSGPVRGRPCRRLPASS